MTTSWKSVVVAAFALCQPALLQAQDTTSTVVASPTSNIKPSGSYGLTFGFKPQYFDESGRYLSHSLSMGFAPAKKVRLTLLGSVNQFFEEERETQLGDTLVRLSQADVIAAGPYSMAARVTGKLPTSPLAQDQKLRGRLSARVSNQLNLGVLSVIHGLGGQKYFYEKTLNESGNANRDYEIRNSLTLALQMGSRVSLSTTGAIVNRFPHVGERQDRYESGVDTGVVLTEKVSAGAGILTSQAQVQDGQVQTAKLYEKDITEAYSSLTVLF